MMGAKYPPAPARRGLEKGCGTDSAHMASESLCFSKAGIMTPSNMSGALPTTTASMSANVRPASSSAMRAAWRTSPAIETSFRLDLATVWPIPMTAHRSDITHPPGHRPGSVAGTTNEKGPPIR